MDHELICSWLGLPADCWPPDHYRLLGLEPGECDAALIEQHVHQRLDSVRRYQMMHPDQATEAMNRLAQAFVCLTDPAARQTYDQQMRISRPRPRSTPPPLPPPAAPSPGPPPLPAPSTPLPVPRDPHVWLYTPGANGPGELPPPPPVRVQLPQPEPEPAPEPEKPPEPPPAPAPPPDPILEAARRAEEIRRGLSTRQGLFRRVSTTRHLLRLWHRMRKYLDEPDRQLGRQDAKELAKLVGQVEEAIEDFPLLGEVAQPGYLIVSLGELERSRSLQNLDYAQRLSLQRDWQAGLRFLEAHRDFLRGELAAYRRLSRRSRFFLAVRAYLNDQPLVGLLILAALTAVGIVIWRMALAE